jgi:hypothetical protein
MQTPAQINETLIRQYYAYFNERRLAEAAKLFADDALLEHIPFGRDHGPRGYIRLAEMWVRAFDKVAFNVERVEARGGTFQEVYLQAVGTHIGVLQFGVYRFTPTKVRAVVRVRELLDIRDDKIVLSSLTVDLNDLITQLVLVDQDDITRRLEEIHQLGAELAECRDDMDRRHDIIVRLGIQLDAARRALRPHFNR